MRYVILLVVLAAAAFFFSFALVASVALAREDALLDFLDRDTVKQVLEYESRTSTSRMFGFVLLLAVWTVVVLVADRLVGAFFGKRD